MTDQEREQVAREWLIANVPLQKNSVGLPYFRDVDSLVSLLRTREEAAIQEAITRDPDVVCMICLEPFLGFNEPCHSCFKSELGSAYKRGQEEMRHKAHDELAHLYPISIMKAMLLVAALPIRGMEE